MKRRDFVELFACASAGFAVSRGRDDVAGKTAITLLNPDCTGGGAGLCAVLRTPSGKTYLFDTANGQDAAHSNGSTIVIPWLKAHGIRAIDGLVISHYHADHFGGFLSMWDAFPIKKVFNNNFLPMDASGRPKHNGESQIARTALDAFAAAHPGALVEDVRMGTDLAWNEPGFSAELVWPPAEGYVGEIKDRPGYGKNDTIYHHLLNGNANALRVVSGGTVFFLMGDIQPDYAARYMRAHLERRGKWGCDVCVLPAHGTNTGEALKLIKTMNPVPRAVIASLGNQPWMESCGRTCVRVYAQAGMDAYATNVHGDVTFVLDGGRAAVTTDPSKRYPLTAKRVG